MFQIAIVYDSGKRYILPFNIVEKYVDKEIIAKIKTEALKEINKL
jgi:hypothetical protein